MKYKNGQIIDKSQGVYLESSPKSSSKPLPKKRAIIKGVIKDDSSTGLMRFIRENGNRNSKTAQNFQEDFRAYLDYHQPNLSAHGNGEHGHTPLTLLGEMDKNHLLMVNDFYTCAMLLLERGANHDAHTADGQHFLSFVWNRNRKYFNFIEDFLDKGYSLGDFDLDVTDGIQKLMANCLISEFNRLGNQPFSLENLSPKALQKIEFYFDILEKKKTQGKKIETNPYLIFTLFTESYSSKKGREWLTEHFEQFYGWFELCQKRGFDINQKDADGKSVVHHGIQIRSKELLEVFHHFGADLFPIFFGTTIESYAFSHQFYDYQEWANIKIEQAHLQTLPQAIIQKKSKKI